MNTKTLYRRFRTQVLAVVLLTFGVTLYSCADLEEDPTIANLAPGKYSNQAELELGVAGIYTQLRNAAQWSTFYVAGWGGDDITTHRVSNKADFREFDQRVVTSENSRSYNNWRDIYKMIRAANSVIESAADLELTDQDAQDRLLGEVYFLRGTLFFHLARVHGRIALPLTSIPELDVPLATQLQVYEQIESDLLQAESLLPAMYPGVEAGAPRPNSGSARSILARLYMDWAGFPLKDAGKYTDAMNSAKTVMDNSGSHGFSLVTDLEDLWKLENRFNSESIWTIAYCVSCNSPNRKFGKLGNPSDLKGWQETFAEIKFYEDMPEGPRKEATYRTEHDWTNFTDQQTPVFKKIVGPINDGVEDISLNDFNTDRTDFYMRYAEVLLIYAEASGHTGNNSSEAYTALNMIRRRAAGLPYDEPSSVDVSSGDLVDLAFTERKWELAGEWIRWNDLVRMEQVDAALSDRDPYKSYNSAGELVKVQNPILGSLGTDNYFHPVPARICQQSPQLCGVPTPAN